MATIDFEHFSIPVGIGRSGVRMGDVRESFANVIYQAGTGIRAHSLALKIYGSKGATPYNEDEAAMIHSMAGRYCTPGFIDGLEHQMGTAEENVEKETKEKEE